MASNNSLTKSSTAELILDGINNDDITIMSPEEAAFSKPNMGRAIEYLEPFLLPPPTTADKKSFDYTKFRVIDSPKDKLQKFLDQHVFHAKVLSMETMLLVVECIMRSEDPVKKAMCRLGGESSSGIQIVFKKWLAYAINIIERKRKAKPDSLKKIQAKTEELVACSIIELICSFGTVIKKEKQLNVLKSKFNVDWMDITEKTLAFALEHNITGLIDSCKKANKHLINVKEGRGLPYKPRQLPEILNMVEEPESLNVKVVGKAVPQDAKNVLPNSAPIISSTQNIMKTKIQTKHKEDARMASNISQSSTHQTKDVSNRDVESRREQNRLGSVGVAASSSTPASRYSADQSKASSNFRPETRGDAPTTGTAKGGWANYKYDPEKAQNIPAARGGYHSRDDRSSYWHRTSNNRPSSSKSAAQTSDSHGDQSHPGNKYERGNHALNKVDLNDTSSKGVNGLADLPGYSSWKNPPLDRSKDSVHGESKSTHALNKVSLNECPSKGVDGLSDLPGFSLWRNAGNDDHSSLGTKGSSNFRSEKFDRKRSDRSDSFENDSNLKRRRYDDETPSSNRSNKWDTQLSRASAGRGRGRDRTLPAWMSKSEHLTESHSSVSSNSRVVEQLSTRTSNNQIPQAALGRGRGRGRTLPAWMTKGESVDASSTGGPHEQKDPIHKSVSSDTGGSYSGPDSSSKFSSETMARGRGRDRTKPAWMAKQQGLDAPNASTSAGQNQNYTSPPPQAPVLQVSASFDSRGRGRGRTLPAWMTNKDSSANNPNVTNNGLSLANKQYSSDRFSTNRNPGSDIGGFQGSGQGAGRGRGRNQTLPAWMTKK